MHSHLVFWPRATPYQDYYQYNELTIGALGMGCTGGRLDPDGIPFHHWRLHSGLEFHFWRPEPHRNQVPRRAEKPAPRQPLHSSPTTHQAEPASQLVAMVESLLPILDDLIDSPAAAQSGDKLAAASNQNSTRV